MVRVSRWSAARGSIAAAITAAFVSMTCPAVAQSPTPAPSPLASPAPEATSPLASRGEAYDDTFALTLATDADRVAAGEPITVTVTATVLHLAPTGDATVLGGGGGPVVFSLEQLDGPVDMWPDHGTGPVLVVFGPAERRDAPFVKAGGYSADDPLATFWSGWNEDPDLRLPAGRYRITATLSYLDPVATDVADSLQASIVIEAVDGAPASPIGSPVPSSQPTSQPTVELWSPVDLGLLPWPYACLGWSFQAGALSPDGAGVSDDPRLMEEVRSHGVNAHLLVADEDVTLPPP